MMNFLLQNQYNIWFNTQDLSKDSKALAGVFVIFCGRQTLEVSLFIHFYLFIFFLSLDIFIYSCIYVQDIIGNTLLLQTECHKEPLLADSKLKFLDQLVAVLVYSPEN